MDATQQFKVGNITLEVGELMIKQITTLKIGDNIRILRKKYDDTYETFPGMVVGIDIFESTPAINFIYVDANSSEPIQFATITEDSSKEKLQIAIASNTDDIVIRRDTVMAKLDREIDDAETRLITARSRKEVFLKYYKEISSDDLKAMGIL